MPSEPPSLHQRLRRVKLLVLDIDGVLSDGRVIYDNQGREIKCFDVKDGHGLKLLMRAGIQVVLLSGRASQANLRRAAELGIDEVHQDCKVKLPVFLELVKRRGLELEEVAYMGDDLIDLPPLRRAGLSLCPADAVAEVRAVAHWIADKPGGRGAVRQACELILKAGDAWNQVTARYQE